MAVATEIPPGLDVTVYLVIALPPLDAGAVQETVAWELDTTADTPVGTPGATGAGVTDAEAAETVPDPSPFVAKTVKV